MRANHGVLVGKAQAMCATGSSVICNPPVTTTDEDYVVLINSSTDKVELIDSLVAEGFQLDGSYNALGELSSRGGWASLKNSANVNYIVTYDEELYNRFVLATKIATEMNLTAKEDRVKLFMFIKHKADLDKKFGKPFDMPRDNTGE
jgi:hypothetical protein